MKCNNIRNSTRTVYANSYQSYNLNFSNYASAMILTFIDSYIQSCQFNIIFCKTMDMNGKL